MVIARFLVSPLQLDRKKTNRKKTYLLFFTFVTQSFDLKIIARKVPLKGFFPLPRHAAPFEVAYPIKLIFVSNEK